MKRSLFVFLIIIIWASFVNASIVTKHFRKGFNFIEGSNVSIKSINGSINVDVWEKDSVRVEALIEVKSRSSRDAKEFLDQVEIVVNRMGRNLEIEPDYPKVRGGNSILDWIFGRRRPNVTIRFNVLVPRKVNLDLKSVNGRVVVDGVEGDQKFKTTNGVIDAENLKGSVYARTTNGGIRVEMVGFNRGAQVSISTTNGGIKLSLPDKIQADVEASTVNGGISTDFPLQVKGKFNSKRINGSINGGGSLIKLRTVNGSIKIYKSRQQQ